MPLIPPADTVVSVSTLHGGGHRLHRRSYSPIYGGRGRNRSPQLTSLVLREKEIEQNHLYPVSPHGVSLLSEALTMNLLESSILGGAVLRLFQMRRQNGPLLFGLYSYPPPHLVAACSRSTLKASVRPSRKRTSVFT